MTTTTTTTVAVEVNQLKDFVERVGWTAIQAGGGLLLSWLESGHIIVWQALAQAVGIAVIKVLLAQQIGNHKLGDAIPGGVLKLRR